MADANLNSSTVSILLTGCFLKVNTAGLELNLSKRKKGSFLVKAVLENSCLFLAIHSDHPLGLRLGGINYRHIGMGSVALYKSIELPGHF